MAQMDKRVDDYIQKAAPFARPILAHLRQLVHQANPGVEETIKWGMPFFDYKGPYCSFAAFKKHVVMGFWKYRLLQDKDGYLQERSAQGGDAMGNLGRIESLADLPPDRVITGYLKQAKKLNDEGVKLPPRAAKPKPELAVPDYFVSALKRNKAAKATFEAFSPSHRREYVEWITEAKTAATREKRMDKALEMLAEGKGRNWKYEEKMRNKE